MEWPIVCFHFIMRFKKQWRKDRKGEKRKEKKERKVRGETNNKENANKFNDRRKKIQFSLAKSTGSSFSHEAIQAWLHLSAVAKSMFSWSPIAFNNSFRALLQRWKGNLDVYFGNASISTVTTINCVVSSNKFFLEEEFLLLDLYRLTSWSFWSDRQPASLQI